MGPIVLLFVFAVALIAGPIVASVTGHGLGTLSSSIFQPGYTMASLIANEFQEATNDLHVSALMAIGAVLFVVTVVVNTIARWLVWQTGRNRAS